MLGLAPAPEFCDDGVQWFNVTRPLKLSELRGRLVILDFWTPCCVNCLHVLPLLRRIEERFGDEVVIIAVNSPKYPAERDPASVERAIQRCGIRHPVLHDPDLQHWRKYGICGWPTLVFIDPHGRILGDLPGEPAADKLLVGVGEMIRHWRGTSPGRPPALPLSVAAEPASRFRFPAKIKPLRRAGQPTLWAIADAGHNQVVLCDDRGRELRRFGCGEPGFVDLCGDRCAFNSPQGLACAGRDIYVADTGNHAIRHIDIATGVVRTLAGTGERGPVLRRPEAGSDACLASVWDLECHDGRLFFANAGTHQLGRLDLGSGDLTPIAGTGTEGLLDGEAAAAELAQPTGLALDPGGRLFFTDSESSAVRVLIPEGGGRVRTLVGAGLFECGRRNGAFASARLQHCRGLAWCDGRLMVVDTYNSALRVLDLDAREVSDIAGAGCRWDTDVRLVGGEPAGVAADGASRLLVADTNHHRVIEILVGDGVEARTWAE